MSSARSFSCFPLPCVAKMMPCSGNFSGTVSLMMTEQIIHGYFDSSVDCIMCCDAFFARSHELSPVTSGSTIVTGLFISTAYSKRSRVRRDPVILSPYFSTKAGL